MAKTKGRPAKPGGEGTPIRVDSDIASKAKYLAAARGVPLSEYVSRLLRPLVEADFKRAAKDVTGGKSEKGDE